VIGFFAHQPQFMVPPSRCATLHHTDWEEKIMRKLLALLLGVFGCSTGWAYQPESGLWWNPAESGSGYNIEISDNALGFTAYLGEANGAPVFYTAFNLLQGNALFEATLYRFSNNQCAGCTWTGGPTAQSVGTVRIAFDASNPQRGTLTWNVPPQAIRSFPIQRFALYEKRAEDGNAPVEVTKMLGEWHVTLDFSEWPNYNAFRYSADVLVLDEFSYDGGTQTWFYDGCRPETSLDATCTAAALAVNSASGFYNAARGRQVVIIDDNSVNSQGQQMCVYLEARALSNDFSAGFTGNGDGGFTLYPCGANPLNYAMYPLKGFRTASRTFVQEGVGPSKRLPAQSFDATPRQREAAPLRTNVDKNDPLTGVAELLSQVRAAEGRVLGKRQ